MNSEVTLGQSAQQFQQMLTQGWGQAMASFKNLGLPGAGAGGDTTPPPKIQFDPARLKQVQENYLKSATELWNDSLKGALHFKDKRFAGEAWPLNPMAAYTAAVYLLNSATLTQLAQAVETDPKTRARLSFAVEQFTAASAPSNFMAMNPDAQKKALETKGQSIAQGLQNLFADLRQGHISQTDESVFEVGKNVATTEGAVVFECEFFQLIEYKPLTEKVHARPFLLVPPCINKYYILDLQPENSFVRYAVAEGHRTFVVSWRNPDESMAQKTWDDYIEHAVIKAIDVAQTISQADKINALGFCVGGTMLGTALAVLAARGQEPVQSATFLTTFLDFSNTGIIDLFVDEAFVRYREQQMAKGGLLKGQELATTFSFLRPNDLVWNYVVGNYLKGEKPPAFDLLYWNSDATNLPGPFYTWYLRNTYHENKLIQPGAVEVCGQKIDFSKVKLPVYLYGSREDHIVPIQGAYASTQVFPGKKRFVMGASGHIAGVINAPIKNKRSHWIREDGQLPKDFNEWLEGATELPGSWWPDWAAWLKTQGGPMKPAPKTYGHGKFKALAPAPGTYVKQKA